MKRAEIVRAVEKHLLALGFTKGQWVWQPATAELILVVAGDIVRFKLKAGLTKRNLMYELGFMSGLARMAKIRPEKKSNGARLNGSAADEHPHHAG